MTLGVLHVLPSSIRNPWLTDLIREMRSDPVITPSIVTFERHGQLHSDMRDLGVEAVSLGRTPGLDTSVIFRLTRLLRERRPAIVHTHVIYPALAHAIASRIAGHRSIWVTTRHQQPGFIDLADVPQWKRSAFKALDGWLHRQMDMVIVISERSAHEVAEFGVRADRMREIPLGFDLRRFRPDPAAVAAVRDEICGTDETLTVSVARLSWEKNLSFLLRCWTHVVAETPSARLVIVGAGPLETELRSQAIELAIADHVTFAGYRTDAIQLIGAADVVVQPSLTENMSMVAVEALAQGRPLVATPVGIIGEHIRDRGHCLVAPPDDARAFADAIIALLGDRTLAHQLGESGRRLVEARFTVEVMVSRYRDLYMGLLRSRTDRAPELERFDQGRNDI